MCKLDRRNVFTRANRFLTDGERVRTPACLHAVVSGGRRGGGREVVGVEVVGGGGGGGGGGGVD